MNKIFTEKEQVTISQFQYDENNELYVGKDVVVETTSGNVRLGYVYEVIDDKETGLQAYVITDSKVVTNKDYETIKNVTILYQGSKGLNIDTLAAETIRELARENERQNKREPEPSLEEKQKDSPYTTSLLKDWKDTNALVVYNIANKITNNPPKQFIAGSKLLNKTMATFPNATFDLNGHSLGGMIVQFVIANAMTPERIRSARSYSAPNIHETLTEEMKLNAKLTKNRLIMYYDRYDWVQIPGNVESISSEKYKNELMSIMMGPETLGEKAWLVDEFKSRHGNRPLPAIGKMVMIDSLKAKSIVEQHIWGGYQYDEKGMPLLLNTTQDDTSILMGALLAIQRYDQMWQKGLYQKLAHIRESYSTEFRLGPDMAQATGIYIDAEQALTVLNGAQASVTAVFHDFRADLNRALSEAETLWADIESKVYQTAQHLSIMEAFAILASEGISEATIVGPVRERVAREESLIAEYEQAYKNLAQNIKTGIKDLVSRDRESAHLIEF